MLFSLPIISNANYKLVSVKFDDSNTYINFIDMGFDLSSAILKENSEITLIVNNYEYELIKNKFKTKIIYDDFENYLATKIQSENKNFDKLQSGKYFTTGTYAGHFTTNEIYANFDSMLAKFPTLISKNEIGRSIENRPIYAYCFGPFGCMGGMSYSSVMINGIHHAREPIGGTINVFAAWKLLELYENGDSEATYLLTNRNIVFVPIINPDGYEINIKAHPKGGGLWRKNARKYNNSVYGVDINRNYGPANLWDFDGKNKDRSANLETYPGTSAFSEPETQAIENLSKTSNFKTVFNYHSYGNVLIYTHGYKPIDCPDSNLLRDFSFYTTRNSNYSFGVAGYTLNYTAQGASDDFHYSNNKALSFIVEVGDYYDFFYTRLDSIIPYCEQNFEFIKQIIWSADANLVVKNVNFENKDGKKILNIQIQNIGKNVSNQESIEISCANQNIEIQNRNFEIPPINSGEILNLFTEMYDDNSIANGSNLIIQTNLNQNNVIKNDSFSIQYYQPRIYEIEIDNFLEKFIHDGNWASNSDYPYNNLIITSNLEEQYAPHLYSYLNLPAQYFTCDNLTFEFEIKYGIELNFDFLEIHVLNYETGRWDEIRTDRMALGSGIADSKQDANIYGYEGFMPMWIKQRINLDKYKNDTIKIKFLLQTDDATNYWGVRLKNLKFLAYEDLSSVKESNSIEILNLPEIIKKGETILSNFDNSIDNITIEIFNNNGISLQKTNSFNSIKTNSYAAGIYFLKIRINNQIYTHKFVLME